MSLKAFHIVFISASVLLAFGCGAWGIKHFLNEGGAWPLCFGVSSVAVGVGLLWYGRYFLKKLKHISYL